MPEIGEIARLVHYLRKHLVGRTIASVKVQDDPIVYGKAGTTAAEFQKAMTGKKVLDAQQQGKYFWMVMSSPPHPLLHASMTGWINLSNDDTSFYKAKKVKDETWPPKFWKFVLETEGEPECQAAFIDPRRLGRIRLLDCAGEKIRQTAPLNQNGPDPVRDKDVFTLDWFKEKVKSRRVAIKAFLLDQANISGIGNWVGDEILFQAKIHPEQYTNSFSDAQLEQLHSSILDVCNTAVDTLADQSKFPENWLMTYRWGKGKKNEKLPTGEKIIFLTVGGRTSAVVPSVQKKTGPVAAEAEAGSDAVKGNESDNEVQERPKEKKKRATPRKRGAAKNDEVDEDEATAADTLSEPENSKEQKLKRRSAGASTSSAQKGKKQKLATANSPDVKSTKESHPTKGKASATSPSNEVESNTPLRRSARAAGRVASR